MKPLGILYQYVIALLAVYHLISGYSMFLSKIKCKQYFVDIQMSCFVCYSVFKLNLGGMKMKKIIYIYILNTMAEWEIGNILQAFSMEAMLKNGNKDFEIRTVSIDRNPVKTMCGLTIVPDCILEEIDDNNIAALILPGAERWDDEKHKVILQKSLVYLENGVLVAAICGATLELANLNVLNSYKHSSNALEYLTFFSKNYKGQELYVESPACIDKNLVTASSAGALLFAKYIIKYLNVFSDEKIEAWYNYYLTGEPKYFMELISQ